MNSSSATRRRVSWGRLAAAVPAALTIAVVVLLPFWARPVDPQARSSTAAAAASAALASPDVDYREAVILVRRATAAEAPATRWRDARLLDELSRLAERRGDPASAARWRKDADYFLTKALADPADGVTADPPPELARLAFLERRSRAEWGVLADAWQRASHPQQPLTGPWLLILAGRADEARRTLEPLAAASPSAALLAAMAAQASLDAAARDRFATAAAASAEPLEKAAALTLLGRFADALEAAAAAPPSPVRAAAVAEITERWLVSGTFPAATDPAAARAIDLAVTADPARPVLKEAARAIGHEATSPAAAPAAAEDDSAGFVSLIWRAPMH